MHFRPYNTQLVFEAILRMLMFNGMERKQFQMFKLKSLY